MMALFIYPLWIFFARTVDRLGKGTEPSRDAILSDEATQTKGENICFHRSMDTLGAVLGPSLAFTSTFILRITLTYSTLRSSRTFG
jgi:hypothetical protein